MKKRQLVKRILCMGLCVMLALTGTTASALADSEDSSVEMGTGQKAEVIAAELDSITSDISDAVALDDSQVEALAEYQINTYMTTEIEAEGQNIMPGEPDAWIDLHDLEGNCFAHIVPLMSSNHEEIGFIVIGGIADGFTHYMMGWDTLILDAYRDLQSLELGAVPVFFPPMEFGYQVGEGLDRRIYALNMGDYTFYDVTTAVAENAESFAQDYQMIRDTENAENMELALFNAQQIDKGYEPIASAEDIAEVAQSGEQAASVARVAVEDVRLECEKRGTNQFLPIQYGGKTYYGGNQGWFYSEGSQNTGCGPVAASNQMCYMALSDSKYKSLYPYLSLSHTGFLDLMYRMQKAIDPSIVGEFSLSSYQSDVKNYAKDNGVSLTSVSMSATQYKSRCASFIKAGLTKNKPVASLNLRTQYNVNVQGSLDDQPYTRNFGWHWVTITKYYQGSDDNRWIAISSWGQRFSLNWDAYWQSSHDANLASMAGYTYFG